MSLVTFKHIRECLTSALAEDIDLSKSEWKVFIAMVIQTLTYGKTSDPLNGARLSMITKLRKDHAKKAAQSIVEKGLFTRVPHREFEFMYTVAHAERIEIAQESKPDQEKPVEPKQPELLTYPEEISDETKQGLRQPLSTLPPAQAQKVVDRVAQAIRNKGEIKKNPLAMGKWLITEVKRGNFSVFTPQTTDSTIRFSPQQPAQTPAAPKQHADLEAKFRDSFFSQIAQLTGETIEAVKKQHGCHV